MRLFCSIVIAVMTARAMAEEPLPFDVKPAKPEDKVTVSKDGTTFTIQSKSGIGSAVVSRTAKDWPKTVTFHFQYSDGKALKGLESFKLVAEKFKIEGSQRTSGKMEFFILNKNGKFVSVATAKVTVKQGKDAMEVQVPGSILFNVKGPKAFEVSWVDFYRN